MFTRSACNKASLWGGTVEVPSDTSMRLMLRMYSERGEEVAPLPESSATVLMFQAPRTDNYYFAISAPPSAETRAGSGVAVRAVLSRAASYVFKYMKGRVRGAARSAAADALCRNWAETLSISPALALSACVKKILDTIEGRVVDVGINAVVNTLRIDDSVQTPAIMPASPLYPGQAFTLSAAVRSNTLAGQGPTLPIYGPTTVQFYRTTTAGGRIARSDMPSGGGSAQGCRGGGCAPRQASVRLTAPSTPATYYYGACVPARFNEASTTGISLGGIFPDIPGLDDLTENNCSEKLQVVVVGTSDLVVSAMTVSPTSISAGQRATLRATVTNNGDAQSPPATLVFYDSDDATITTGDESVSNAQPVATLASGASVTVSVTLPPEPQGFAGASYYGACVSAVADESNTANNCSTGARYSINELIAPRPGLFIENPQVSPSMVTSGQRLTVRVEVRNAGLAASTATRLRYFVATVGGPYHSSDFSRGAAEFFDVFDSVPALEPSGASTQSGSLSVHRTNVPGHDAFYVGACLEPSGGSWSNVQNCSIGARVVFQ